MSKKKKTYIKFDSKVASILQGPLVFSAPHGLHVYRGDKDNCRLHSREKYTTAICLKLSRYLSKKLGGESFILWNERIAKPRNKSNHDPNYLKRSQFSKCKFHQVLTDFRGNFYGKIGTLHIDIHGKKYRKKCKTENIDVGIQPMNALWENKEEVKKLSMLFTEELYKAIMDENKLRKKEKKKQVIIDTDPALHGFWGYNTVTTMSHQSVLFKMPAVQFELPPSIRKKLVENNIFLEKFGNAILNVYLRYYGLKVSDVKEKMKSIVKKKKNVEYNKFLSFVRTIDNKTMRKQF